MVSTDTAVKASVDNGLKTLEMFFPSQISVKQLSVVPFSVTSALDWPILSIGNWMKQFT